MGYKVGYFFEVTNYIIWEISYMIHTFGKHELSQLRKRSQFISNYFFPKSYVPDDFVLLVVIKVSITNVYAVDVELCK